MDVTENENGTTTHWIASDHIVDIMKKNLALTALRELEDPLSTRHGKWTDIDGNTQKELCDAANADLSNSARNRLLNLGSSTCCCSSW